MDYEQKYKEILEWARKNKARLNGVPIEDVLPELAESEDEKTRRFLLDYAIEMIAGLESDILRSTYDGIKGHDPEAEAELTEWQKARVYLEKQKPAEWSEEDESCWNLIWDILDGSFTASKEGYKKAAAWFLKNCPKGTKSLRPSWKPSEEQMNALQVAAMVSKTDFNTLTSLLADLKKL